MTKKLKQYIKWYLIGIIFITLLMFNINRFGSIPNELIYGIYLSFTALFISLFKYDDTNYQDEPKDSNINSNDEIKCM
jgi:hypothetical protein